MEERDTDHSSVNGVEYHEMENTMEGLHYSAALLIPRLLLRSACGASVFEDGCRHP